MHSDEHCEGRGALEIDMSNFEGPVGCGRWQRGAEIARTAFSQIGPIIEEIKLEAPSVIEDLEDEAHRLAEANAKLADRTLPSGELLLAPGRQVVISAIKNGAKGIVLAGDHVEEEAEYCLRENETNDTRVSQKRFQGDGWVNKRFFDRNSETFKYNPPPCLIAGCNNGQSYQAGSRR